MSDLELAWGQVRATNRSFWRNPASAFFTVAFPLMFLVIFTALFGNDDIHVFGKVIALSTYYVSAIAAFSIITATYTNLAISMTFQRDGGILKRARGTPLPAWAFLAGRIVHAIALSVMLAVAVTLFGALFYGAEVPTRTLPAFVATVIVGSASFSALGLAITSVVPNADAAPAVVNATIMPLLFLGDIFIPIQNPHAWYVVVSKVFPVYHFAQAMKGAYFAPTGSGLQAGHLLIVAIWGVVGVVAAVKFFSWEPRR
ncbi:MAG TPA: ABC transporter permease [Actinomycetota bacterium]|nr:ABC transporter permease [Actinomycetota bacterium]